MQTHQDRAALYFGLAVTLALGATGVQAQSGNTKFGTNALLSNTTGDSNSAFGSNSLRNTTSGSDNTAIGESALFNNLTGSSNTAIGWLSLQFTTGHRNTASGSLALN